MQKLPMEGTRVLDFGNMYAGPHAIHWLGVMGAEVIKIESRAKLDNARLKKAPDGSERFASFNFGKKSAAFNFSEPRAIELAKKLIKKSDVVAENFKAGTMERWGLGYGDSKNIKPDIIFYTGSGYGRTGPLKDGLAYAQVLYSFDGTARINSYPGGEPNTIGVDLWTDANAAMHATFAIMSALYCRSKTGQGQYIDEAMIEASGNFLGEVIMDYTMNNRIPEPVGNRDNIMAPHGVYRCQGEDKWVAISVANQREWEAFCKVIGNPDWTKEERFSDELSRWHNQEQLDKYVEEWTKKYDHYEAADILQKAGVTAGASLRVEEVFTDPQLKARDFFFEMDHPAVGKLPYARLPWVLSDVPKGNHSRSPLLGEDNDYVFGELLGLSQDEIVRLEKEKVIY